MLSPLSRAQPERAAATTTIIAIPTLRSIGVSRKVWYRDAGF
jgi:hypothetical protein